MLFHNKFYNIGNNGGTSLRLLTQLQILITNKSIGDWFSRTKELMLDVTFNNVPDAS